MASSLVSETMKGKPVKKIGKKPPLKMKKTGAKSKVGKMQRKGTADLKTKGRKVDTCAAPKKIERKVASSAKKGEGITRPAKSTKHTSMLRSKPPVATKAKVKNTVRPNGPKIDHKTAPKKLEAKVKAATAGKIKKKI